jgi:(2Fe-2S) ferredoxin
LALRRPVLDAEETISKKKKYLKEKPAAKVRDYESHVLICTGSDCKKRGAKETRKAIKSEVRSKGLLGEVRLDTVDCLGLCKHGPNAVVYDGAVPKGTWYLGLDESDAPEVVEQHLKNGEPVERLAAQRRPRKEKKTRK